MMHRHNCCLDTSSCFQTLLMTSDVTKLFKIRIRRMRISTSKIRRIRMRMLLDKRLFYHLTCNTGLWMCEYVFANVNITEFKLVQCNTSLNKNYVAHSITVV